MASVNLTMQLHSRKGCASRHERGSLPLRTPRRVRVCLAARPQSEAVREAGTHPTPSVNARALYSVAEAATTASPHASQAANNPIVMAAAVAGLGLAAYGAAKLFDSGSRAYQGNVGQEYDAWTEEGVLEYYWGEHIHLGYYTEAERAAGYTKKDFKLAKYDFVDEMLRFSGSTAPKSILDVGCGFGGSSRHLAKKFREAQVTGKGMCSCKRHQGVHDVCVRSAGTCILCTYIRCSCAASHPRPQASRCPPSKWSVAHSWQRSRVLPMSSFRSAELCACMCSGAVCVCVCVCVRARTSTHVCVRTCASMCPNVPVLHTQCRWLQNPLHRPEAVCCTPVLVMDARAMTIPDGNCDLRGCTCAHTHSQTHSQTLSLSLSLSLFIGDGCPGDDHP